MFSFSDCCRNGTDDKSEHESPSKPAANIQEDEKLKEMIYFMYNYVQQKEKIEKQHDANTDGSDSSSSEKASKTGNSSSLMSSPGSLQSPGSRSSLSDTSSSSPYGLLQMVDYSLCNLLIYTIV